MQKLNLHISKHRSSTKGFNKHKLFVIEQTKKLLNDISICTCYAPRSNEDRDPVSCVFQGKQRIKVTESLAWALDNIRVRWDIVCGVLCRRQDGSHYAQYVSFRAKEECLSVDMSDLALDCCKGLFEQATHLHKLFPFWIAVPRSNEAEIDRNFLLKTLSDWKALNICGTNFEIDCRMPVVDYHKGKEWFDLKVDWEYMELELE